MTWFRTLLILLVVASCGPRDPVLLSDQPELGTHHTIFVGTTRAPDAARYFGSRRQLGLNLARFDISIPPAHEAGEIERSRGNADPARHFMATRAERYGSDQAFIQTLSQTLAARPAGKRVVTLFIHGFNNKFADGLYRSAQFKHDLGIDEVLVHFSWPSFGNPLGYGYDRDSVLFSRDGLERLIRHINAAGADELLIVSHSMGTLLTMEVLRQISIADDRQILDLISGVVLISADIDVGLFDQMAHQMDSLPQPFVILASSRDRALRLSARVSGSTNRLGNVTKAERLSQHDITLIDVSEFSTGIGHFPAATSPALIRLLSRISQVSESFDDDPSAQIGLLPGTAVVIRNATEIVLPN